MSKFIRRFELPVPSTEFVTGTSLHLFGRTALIRFDYFRDGKPKRTGIYFNGISSTRYRSERCCKGSQIKSFDALIEFVDSQWVETLRNEISKMYRDEFSPHHYSIYFESVGCFEVLADDFEVIPEEDGTWEESKKALIRI